MSAMAATGRGTDAINTRTKSRRLCLIGQVERVALGVGLLASRNNVTCSWP